MEFPWAERIPVSVLLPAGEQTFINEKGADYRRVVPKAAKTLLLVNPLGIAEQQKIMAFHLH
jgi:hypothetical protein